VVLVDTSIWIEYIDRVNPLVEAEMDMLLLAGKVATAGMVLAELRRGCRTRDQAKRMLGRLQELPYLEVDRDNWLAAGEMVVETTARGYKLGIADCLLATLALRNNCLILTLDQDFKRIPGLKLYPLRRA
jgi:predicted nucleic acid-binding protein